MKTNAGLGQKIREARIRAGKTQQDACELLQISRPTYISIEKGTREAKREELEALLEYFGVSIGDLLQSRASISDVLPHLRSSISNKRGQNSIDSATALLLTYAERFRFLEDVLSERKPSSLPDERPIPRDGSIEVFAQSVASAERSRLRLGEQPVARIRSLLDERAGVRIFVLPLLGALAGIYAHIPDFGYYIIVNRRHPETRRRWTVAHEYGHFLTERHAPGVDYTAGYKRKPVTERFADAFAAEFLMPREGIQTAFYRVMESSRDFHVADLCRLATRYRVSVQAMTLRLEELRLIDKGTWEVLQEDGFKPAEAIDELGLTPSEVDNGALERYFPDSYIDLAVRAHLEGKISLGRFAELVDCNLLEARDHIEGRRVVENGTATGRPIAVDPQRSLFGGVG